MKTLIVFIICLAFVAGPVLADMEREAMHEVGRHGHFGEQAWNVVKHGAEQAVEHKEKVAAAAVGTNVGLQPAGHKPVAVVAASGHASSTVAVVLTSLAVASVFIALFVYDVLNPSGATAFEGSTWETCANASWTGSLHDTCKRHGFLSR